MNLIRRRLLLAAASVPVLAAAGCGKDETSAAVTPVEIDPGTTCDLDGMLLADYPGPKAQIHFAGTAAPVFYCDTVEMFATLLRPEQQRPVRAVFAQDVGKADWDKPRGHWFDARTGFYVVGSRRHGSMGPTIASFSAEEDARKFSGVWGGNVVRYAEVRADKADLGGGSRTDGKM